MLTHDGKTEAETGTETERLLPSFSAPSHAEREDTLISFVEENKSPILLDKPLTKKRKAHLSMSYASYAVPVLYAILLFNSLSRWANDSENSDEDIWYRENVFVFFYYLFLGIAVGSDVYTNVIGTTAVPEVVYALMEGKGESEILAADERYNLLTELQKSAVRRSFWITEIFAWNSFFVIGLSCVDALNINNIYANAVLTGLLGLLGFYYGQILLLRKTKEHHVWLLSRIINAKKEMLPYFKQKFPEVLEFSFGMGSNIFYKILTYAFIVAQTLIIFGVKNRNANLGLVVTGGFLGGFQTLFTRFVPAKKYILDRNQATMDCSTDNPLSFYTQKFAVFLIGMVRSLAIGYLLWRYLDISPSIKKFLVGPLVVPFLLLNIVYARRFASDPERDSNLPLLINLVNFITNIAARGLRVGAIAIFALVLTDFMKSNGIKFDIDPMDAIMISLVSSGVEINNYTFYKLAMTQGSEYWKNKITLEKNYAQTNGERFNWPRFFFRSTKEYQDNNQSINRENIATTHADSNLFFKMIQSCSLKLGRMCGGS